MVQTKVTPHHAEVRPLQVHRLHNTESSNFCDSMASRAISTGSTSMTMETLGGLQAACPQAVHATCNYRYAQ